MSLIESLQETVVGTALRVEDLHCGYGKKEVLRGVSLWVRPGEIVAFVGPNGAGKSTLLKAVAGLLPLSRGRVYLNGRDITALPPHRRVRAGLAYLMQAGAIFPSLTAEEHLVLGNWAAGGGPRTPSELRRSGQLPRDLATRLEPAGSFSGGQRQQLALASVLVAHPTLLLCDEPSAGLAPGAAKDLFQQIAGLGIPLLCWVEQRVGDILPLVHRAILLREGRIMAETDAPQTWLSPGVLAEMTFGNTTNETFARKSMVVGEVGP